MGVIVTAHRVPERDRIQTSRIADARHDWGLTHTFVKHLTRAGMDEQQADTLVECQAQLINDSLATAFSCTVVSTVTRFRSRSFAAFEANAASMAALNNDSTPSQSKSPVAPVRDRDQ